MISVETNLIVVNATVTDALENYVSGLKAEDFKILEDTAPQRILDLTVEEAPFAAAILLDASGSLGHKLSLARAACGNFFGTARRRHGGGIQLQRIQSKNAAGFQRVSRRA